jgi:hypothetical protein
MTRNKTDIRLRMYAFRKGEKWYMLSLDTSIAVQADSWEELTEKMKDATILYLESFSQAELAEGKWVRNAPLKYRMIWQFKDSFVRAMHLLSGPLEANYDPLTSRMRFA